MAKKATKLAKKKISKTDIWDQLPKWRDANSFRTPQFQFNCSVSDYSGQTNTKEVSLLKDRNFLDIYRKLTSDGSIQNIFELGFFQGGMPLFLADMIKPKKIVAVDWNPPTENLNSLIANSRLSTEINLIGNVDQANTAQILKIVESHFGKEPLDLIIDDCSHYYELSKGCFEKLFGYLKPGGKYVIEDWGWTHWPGEPWQSDKSHFHNKSSLSNLVFEIVMAFASRKDLIAHIEIPSWACVVITRGSDLPHGEPLDLSKVINVAGGRYAKLIAPASSKVLFTKAVEFLKRRGFLASLGLSG